MLVRPRCRGFLFLYNVGRSLHRRTLLKVMRMALVQAGMNKFSFNTHSFRMGHTTDLALSRVSPDKIRMISRWSSDAYLKYIKPSCISLPL